MEQKSQSGGGAFAPSTIRFGAFQLDLRAGELRKAGRKIRLQEQPFQILRLLLESPGEAVLREEIRSRLWPDGVVVEFDRSINAAVKRLRDVLGDSAEKPRYIETLSRRGYRFIGEVDGAGCPSVAEPVAINPEKEQTNRPAGEAPRRPGLPLSPRIFVPVLLATIILIVVSGTGFYRRGARPLAAHLQPLMRLDVDLGTELTPRSDRGGANAILSPDGTRLVYVSQSKLFTRRLDQTNATELPGTEGAWGPFFSPDGQWVAFFGGGSGLKKVSLQGGKVITLCKVDLGGGGSWGDDGNIIAAVPVLTRIPSAGGVPIPVTKLAPGEIVHRWPQVLPGGKAVVFSAYGSMYGLDSATVEVLSLRDGRRKTLIRGGTWGRYLPTGHLIYINKGTLFGVPFDLDRLEVHGTPTSVLEGVAYSEAWGSAEIDFSRTGTLVYRSSRTGGGLVTVQWLDSNGNTRPLLPVPGNYLSPTLSPNGRRLALISAGDIWVYELGHGSMMRLTVGGGYSDPVWTADGHYIVFQATGGMWWIRADGTGQPQLLTPSNNLQLPNSFTADGKRLAFLEITPASGASDIWTVSVESGSSGLRAGKPELFLQTPFRERMPMISPDGRWMVYQSGESGKQEVYVQAFPDGHSKRQISGDRGGYPKWSRNGHELFFWPFGPNPHLKVAAFEARGDSFVAGNPRVWSERVPAFLAATKFYDPAPDGKSLVALMPADRPEEPHDRVTFLLNFFDELRRRLPPI